ncbi:MAG: T9SS type A sorting domain-containing protein [Bacteroidetes bacterium]|nr:T9SS type A sorting domain-containing protein [Bacteroidota bacterium]
MKELLFVTFAYLLSINIVAQVIPDDRRVDWESVTQNMSFIQPTIQINVKDFGAIGDGVSNDQPAIVNAISSLNGRLGYIYFPSGKYLVENQITLPDSCILKGSGSNESTILLDMGENAVNCISISKSQSSEFTSITEGFTKGNNLISVEDISQFTVGGYIEIRQKNGDWDIAPISWADYSVGQITRVLAIEGSKLHTESGLRIDYDSDLEPEVRPITPISNSGIQCIKITRVDEPEEGAGANIYTYMAANCLIRGIESDSSVGAHVSINSSINVLIDGSYFHNAFAFDGVGMRGYGVALSQHTSECLITNNIFKNLRHAMMIKTGSNGNIFSYNYSLDPHRSEPIPDASGDISFHGHYAFSNLWEGNIVQNIIIDHYWGPSGPYNTLFRNHAELYGIIMTTNNIQETNTQNFVGNEVTNTEFLHGLYTLTGENHFEYSNNVKGDIIPPGTTTLNDSSYYLVTKPDFWSLFVPWPSVGFPNQLGNGTIPAKLRYESGNNFTVCPDSIITNINNQSYYNQSKIKVWPNPSSTLFNIKLPENLSSSVVARISNSLGVVIYSENIETPGSKIFSIPIRNLTPGVYILTVKTESRIFTKKIIISQ